MELLFKLLFGKGTAATIAAVLFFSDPEFTFDANTVMIKGRLNGIFNSQVERILNTGTELIITYDVSLIIGDKKNKTLKNQKIEQIISFSTLEKTYTCSVNSKKYFTKDRDDAYKCIEEFETTILDPSVATANKIEFYIEASIHYLSSLEFDIPENVLWDYYIPNKKIRNIKKPGTQ